MFFEVAYFYFMVPIKDSMCAKTNGVLLCGLLVVTTNDAMERTKKLLGAGDGDSRVCLICPEMSAYLVDSKGNTDLHQAAARGNAAAVGLLVQSGLNLENVKNKDGKTPLHYAAEAKNGLECVKILVEHGADIDAKDSFNQTALELAAFSGGADIVAYLISRAASITSLAIDMAFRSGNFEIFMQFLNALGLYSAKSGETPLHYFAQQGLYLEAEYFLDEKNKVQIGQKLDKVDSSKWFDLNHRDFLGRTPLHCAVLGKHAALLRLLINHGAQIYQADVQREQPLHYAVKQGSMSMIMELLKNGALSVWADDQGKNIIHVAVDENQFSVARTIALRFNNLLDQPDRLGRYPLHYAARRCSEHLVQTFLSIGAKADVQDRKGKTPMHYAVEGEDPAAVIKIIGALIAKGASVFVDDADGKIPTELTTNREVKYYLGRCADKERMARASEMSHPIVAPIPIRASVFSLEWLLGLPKETEALRREQPAERQPSYNQAPVAKAKKPGDGSTAEAVMEPKQGKSVAVGRRLLDPRLYGESAAMIKYLLRTHQADPRGIDMTGKTALHHLMIQGKGYANVIQEFVNAGGDINARDYLGRTALYYGVLFGRKTVHHLIERGANPAIADNEGKRPFELSDEKYYREIFAKWLFTNHGQSSKQDEVTGVEHAPACSGEKPVSQASASLVIAQQSDGMPQPISQQTIIPTAAAQHPAQGTVLTDKKECDRSALSKRSLKEAFPDALP